MPVTIIAGRAGSGKSAIIYSRINNLTEEKKDSVLLVPEQFTLQAERELIASGNHEGLIYANVMSVSRLVKEMFLTVGSPNKTLIDERGKAAAIRTVADSLKDELKIFGRAASYAGFAAEAATLISDFKKHDISPQALKDAASASMSGNSASKIHDISLIYSAYDEFFKNKNYIDADDRTALAAELILKAESLKSTRFFMDGYDKLTSSDINIAGSILKLTGNLTICVNYSETDEELFYSGKKAMQDLIKLAQDENQSYEIIYASNPHIKKHASILHLEKNLFSESPAPFSGETSIKIHEASTMQEEAESIACSILNILKDNPKHKFSDISILCCGKLNEYAPLFERMFARYKVPCFTHRRKSIAEHPAVSYLISAVTAKIYNTPKSETLAMLKSGYAGVDYSDAMLFEDYVLDNAIDGYLFTKELKRGAKNYDLEKINKIREKLVTPLDLLSNKKLPANEHLKSIYSLMDTVGMKKTMEQEREILIEKNILESAAISSQVYNSIISILEQLGVLFESSEMTLEQILKALEESFITTQLGILPVTSDEVIIGELGRTKLAETKYLFIAGASENTLPAPNSQSPIFSDWDIEALTEQGIDFSKGVLSKRSASDYDIYQAFSLPSKTLYISYAENGTDGNNLPSSIIKQIEDIFDIETEKAVIDYTVSQAAALSYAAKAFGAIGDGRIEPGGWKQAVSALINTKKAERELNKMQMFLSAPDCVPEIAIKKDRAIISSVSQIEQYANCPFSYMVKYSLFPKDDPGEDITPAGEGSFLHEAMERFGKKLAEYDVYNMPDNEIESVMQDEAEIIATNFDMQRLSRDEKGKYQAQSLIKKAKHGAVIYSKHLKNSKFVPQGQEIEFSEKKDLGPIEISLKSGTKVKIKGKVDRLDTFVSENGEYARIVDYKSSVKKIDYSKIEAGTQLQLLIYMDAYLLHQDNVKASGVFYFPVRKTYIDEEKGEKRNDKMQGLFVDTPENIAALDKDIDELGASSLINAKRKKDGSFDRYSDNISSEGFYKVMDYAKSKARESLSDMDSGQIPVRPVTDGNISACKYCDYSSICKKDINMHEERQTLDKDSAKKAILGEDDG